MSNSKNHITKDGIRIHEKNDFLGMAKAGRIAAYILDTIGDAIVPGIMTIEIDRIIHDMIVKSEATSATVGYKGYKHSSCISINHVVCHGIPGPKTLNSGDILNIDVTVLVEGWYGDSSRMYCAGNISKKSERLITVTHDALFKGIEQVKPGNTFGDIGFAIQNYAEANGMSVVRDFCGHGLGRVFHAPPNVLHYGVAGSGPILEEGMFFTIEPMINLGKPDTKVLNDGWTAVTRDKSLSSQFEHSVGVTSNGFEIFTLSPKNLFF
jgi:methionyl aminopeptidase